MSEAAKKSDKKAPETKKRKAQKDDDDDMFVVVTKTYPTTYGCHQGMSWSFADLIQRSSYEVSKECFQTRKEAIKHAVKTRERLCEFDDYDEWDDEPPWNSADLQNYDNDEETVIHVMTKGAYNAAREEDRRILEKANMEIQFKWKVKKGILRERAMANKGRAFYNIPNNPDSDVPAELELDETSDLEKKLEKDLASIKSLRFVGGRNWGTSLDFWQEGSKADDEKTVPPDLLLETLAKCTSLEELHLKLAECRAVLSKGYFERLLKLAPHLKETLQVLSFPNVNIEPDALCEIAQFSKLEHLDMWYSLSVAYYDFGREFEDDDAFIFEELPYDKPLLECTEKLTHLTQVDLGHGEQDMKKAMHDYSLSRHALSSIRDELSSRNGLVTMDATHMPRDFPNSRARKEAHRRVLTRLSTDESESAVMRELATDELKTCSQQNDASDEDESDESGVFYDSDGDLVICEYGDDDDSE